MLGWLAVGHRDVIRLENYERYIHPEAERPAGNGIAEVAGRAQQLLEHSLLSELRALVARALSGLDMFAGSQLSELELLGSGTDYHTDGEMHGVRTTRLLPLYILASH